MYDAASVDAGKVNAAGESVWAHAVAGLVTAAPWNAKYWTYVVGYVLCSSENSKLLD